MEFSLVRASLHLVGGIRCAEMWGVFFRGRVRGGGFWVGNCVILVGNGRDGGRGTGDGGFYGLCIWKSFRMVSKILLLGIVCSSFR